MTSPCVVVINFVEPVKDETIISPDENFPLYSAERSFLRFLTIPIEEGLSPSHKGYIKTIVSSLDESFFQPKFQWLKNNFEPKTFREQVQMLFSMMVYHRRHTHDFKRLLLTYRDSMICYFLNEITGGISKELFIKDFGNGRR